VIEEENYDPYVPKAIEDNQNNNNSNDIEIDNNNDEAQIFDEEYGRLKMERFKEHCRNILGQQKKN
jgi:hypothetical protein